MSFRQSVGTDCHNSSRSQLWGVCSCGEPPCSIPPPSEGANAQESESPLSRVPEWRLTVTQRKQVKRLQNGHIMSPPNDMMAKEPEDLLMAVPQAWVPQQPSRTPPESLGEDCVQAMETMTRRNPLNPADFSGCSESSTMRMYTGPAMSLGISWSLLGCG